MAGHSKWSNIKRKKGKADSQKAKVFTKISRQITVAIREGGPDPEMNSKLRELIILARESNVPNDNINRLIKKSSDKNNKESFEEVVYEGYGPDGVAVIVETLTDNRNRTAGEVRHAFDKHSGNLGTSGNVSYMFLKKGIFLIERSKVLDEDKLMDIALEAGAEEFISEEEAIEIQCDVPSFLKLKKAFKENNYDFDSSKLEMVPDTYVSITDEVKAKDMLKMIDQLEDSEDVQEVWHNWENQDDFLGDDD